MTISTICHDSRASFGELEACDRIDGFWGSLVTVAVGGGEEGEGSFVSCRGRIIWHKIIVLPAAP